MKQQRQFIPLFVSGFLRASSLVDAWGRSLLPRSRPA
jgi:hypothetical protein